MLDPTHPANDKFENVKNLCVACSSALLEKAPGFNKEEECVKVQKDATSGSAALI